MDHDQLTERCYGVFPEGEGFRFLVFAEGIEQITITLNDETFPLEPAALKPNVYTKLFHHLKAPFTYVYNIYKNNSFYPDLLDPFCPFTDLTGTKSVYRSFAPFTFQAPKPHYPNEKLLIYELCPRGFTKDPSSQVTHPGTFEGIIEKIPHIQKLGFTAIELMPITLFDPHRIWGYMPRSFMALAPHLSQDPDPTLSFKKVVEAAHAAGLAVIVDLVFNHTDTREQIFYPFSNQCYLENFDATGCGNTVNTSHPWTQALFAQAFQLFVEEYQIDGIRFDLGLALCRESSGNVLMPPAWLHAFENLYKHKIHIFYEPWDTAGYMRHEFPTKNGLVWDDQVRDTLRRFIRGDEGQVRLLHDLLHSPNAVKMITCHDGFTLSDLVSYNEKHNLVNGYQNRDGHNSNFSNNCGVEGVTDDPVILLQRRRRRESILALFCCFSGPLLFKAGDEMGNTQFGNNNPFNQDNKINYVQWDSDDRQWMEPFFSQLLLIYKTTPLSNPKALIKFHGQHPHEVYFYDIEHFFSISKSDANSTIFFAVNSWCEPLALTLPDHQEDWKVLLTNTDEITLLQPNTFVLLEKKNI